MGALPILYIRKPICPDLKRLDLTHSVSPDVAAYTFNITARSGLFYQYLK